MNTENKKPAIHLSKTEWDLTVFFDGDDDPRMAEKRAVVLDRNTAFIKKWKNRDDYLTDPEVLRRALEEYEALLKHWGTGGDEERYFDLRSAQDEDSPILKAKQAKIEEFSRKLSNEIQFFELSIAKIPKERRQIFLDYQGLRPYRHYLEIIFAAAAHLLSDQEERIMTLKSGPALDQWVRMTSGFLAREARVVPGTHQDDKKSISNILHLLDHADKAVRDSAARVFNEILAEYVDVAEKELNAILENKKIDDELRGYPRPDSARHRADDIDTEIVDAVIGSVAERFDISRRFYQLKARLLGLPKLQYHERNVPYGAADKEYSFEEAVLLVYRVFQRLDPKFSAILKQFVEDGRIDVYPRKKKHSGAFCSYGLLTHPVYILLNYTGKLRDVITLAHEAGHGINNVLMQERQNALTFGTSLATAEVASTFMEDFIVQELLAEADDELRLSLLVARLNDNVSTIFRQAACYRFEQELHKTFREHGYLSKDEIGRMFQKHMAAYMGDAVEQSAGSENWWVYWNHIRSFFYVYSYVSGLLISKAMQSGVKKDPAFIASSDERNENMFSFRPSDDVNSAPSYIEKVKEFLAAGRSDSPQNIFAKLGIDISQKSFWDEGIGEVEKLLRETELLAQKLGKL